MTNILILLCSIFTIFAGLPYILDILKNKTKPRVFSWIIWAMLTAISAAASFSDKQYAAFFMSLSASIECVIIVILGFKYGDTSYSHFDITCFIGAIIGIVLWYFTNSPSVAILIAIILDIIGVLPTYRHAWARPFEETWLAFAMAGIGALFAILAATSVRVTSLAFPVYAVIVNIIITTTILLRRNAVRRIAN